MRTRPAIPPLALPTLTFLLACLALTGAGCAARQAEPTVVPAALRAPAGLSVRAEVHVRDTIAAARFSPGVYLLEPDGTLRVADRQPRTPAGPDGLPMPPETIYPPILRRLSPSEVDRLWRLIGPGTLADPANPERIGPSADWSPPPGRSVALIDIEDNRGRRRFAISLTGGTPAAIDGRALIERLQALAWRTPPPAATGP
ncbi:MAG: hypothetical protein ACIAS6_02805 [Phycisphaerales bacterium JB060]